MDSTRNQLNIHTFGCKVNTYDTGLIEKGLHQSELSFSGGPSVHILNTCAVTAEATQEAIRLIKKLRLREPDSKIVVTGCGAQVDGAKIDLCEEADLVVANSHKAELPVLLGDLLNGRSVAKVHRSNIFRKDDLGEGGGEESHHTRSFLKIQDGCNSFCSFCIIPYARGKSRSLSISQMIERVNELYRQGVREVVLTGVHIGDYSDLGDDGGNVEDLLESLLNFTRMPRFRLGSFEPPEITDRLLEIFTSERMCRHFHVSAQSAQSQILQKMKRKYSAEDVEAVLNKIQHRLPDTFVGMDIISGFPGESEEHFLETYERLNRSPWSRLHVFPYSERQGTKAAIMSDSVYPHVRKARAQRLRTLSALRYNESAENQIGKSKQVIVLKGEESRDRVLSMDYWNVWVEKNDQVSQNAKRGDQQQVRITGVEKTGQAKADLFLKGEWVTT